MTKLKLSPFTKKEFLLFKSWIDSNELLITVAGTDFKFPVTDEQLSHYLKDDKRLSFNVIDVEDNKIIGHAEITQTEPQKCKLDKVIIGDMDKKGMDIGKELLTLLLDHAFKVLSMNEVELYVYNWNIAGIKSYEKVGFSLQPDIQFQTTKDVIDWTTLLMSVKKEDWFQVKIR